MFRVGVLGAENSHAMAFAQIFNGLNDSITDDFSDIRMIGVGGDDPVANRKVFEKCGLGILAEKPEDLLGKVDAIMITARDGQRHAEMAKPFVEAGIPAFIDKPFTRDVEQALELARLARRKGTPLVGGSSVRLCPAVQEARQFVAEHRDIVRGGDVTSPVSMVNDYGNFWFYAAHLAETCIEIFGMPQWVWASEHKGGVTVVAHYADFEITNHYMEGVYHYSTTLVTKDGIIHRPIDISQGYALECREFAAMLRHGEMLYSYEQLVQPVFYIAAVEKSLKTGEKQVIPPISL